MTANNPTTRLVSYTRIPKGLDTFRTITVGIYGVEPHRMTGPNYLNSRNLIRVTRSLFLNIIHKNLFNLSDYQNSNLILKGHNLKHYHICYNRELRSMPPIYHITWSSSRGTKTNEFVPSKFGSSRSLVPLFYHITRSASRGLLTRL